MEPSFPAEIARKDNGEGKDATPPEKKIETTGTNKLKTGGSGIKLITTTTGEMTEMSDNGQAMGGGGRIETVREVNSVEPR